MLIFLFLVLSLVLLDLLNILLLNLSHFFMNTFKVLDDIFNLLARGGEFLLEGQDLVQTLLPTLGLDVFHKFVGSYLAHAFSLGLSCVDNLNSLLFIEHFFCLFGRLRL